MDPVVTALRQQVKVLVAGVVLMVIAGFAPAVLLWSLGWGQWVNISVLTGLALFLACVGGTGWRTGLIIAAPFALLCGLTDWAAHSALLAAGVLAVAAFLRGYAAKAGLHDALTMAVIALGFIAASPPQSDAGVTAPLYVTLISLGTALWATLIMYFLRHRLPARKHTGLNPIRVLSFGLILAFLVGLATWAVVTLNLGHTGGWIILTIVVVFQPALGAGFKKAWQRAAGTIVGFLIAMALGAVLPLGPVLFCVGAIFLIAAFVLLLQNRPYWLYASLLTPAIVLLESSGSPVEALAQQRLIATLVGVTATMLVMLAFTPFAEMLVDRSRSRLT